MQEPIGVYVESDAKKIKERVLPASTRLPGANGGNRPYVGVGEIIRVKLTKTGGSLGTNAPPAPCTATYTAKWLDDVVGTNLEPTWGRYLPKGLHTEGTEGLGFFDPDGTFKLLSCNEKISTVTDCEGE